jgi:hypothetical protein
MTSVAAYSQTHSSRASAFEAISQWGGEPAPLDRAGNIDLTLWHKHRQAAPRPSVWGDEEESGFFVHKPGGSKHARWMFAYDGASNHKSEAAYRFGKHSFGLGEYVSIGDPSGELHTFRVVSVEPTE